MPFPRLTSVTITAALCLVSSPRASAQVIAQQRRTDTPAVIRVAPACGRPGEKITVRVTGDRLKGLSRVLCTADVKLVGVKQDGEKALEFELQIAKTAVPGRHEFHLLCQRGLSNPRVLRIESLNTVMEKEDNNRIATAMEVTVPVAVEGQLNNQDEDHFRFSARAGQHWTFDLEANRVGSPVRGVLTLFDRDGQQLAKSSSPSSMLAGDPLLNYRFTRDGQYVVRISERIFQGGPYSTYHLRIGTFPVASGMFPLGGRRGAKTRLQLLGGNMMKPVWQELQLTEANRRVEHAVRLGPTNTPARPMRFAVGDYEELTETTDFGDKQPVMIELPRTVNGRIGVPGDRDMFGFRATQGQPLLIDVAAQRLGSFVDPAILILDAKGKRVAESDDANVQAELPPLTRPSTMSQTSDDVIFTFAPPATGNYSVVVFDRFGQGGDAFAYRMTVSPPAPDFELVMQPGVVTVPTQPNPRQRRNNQQVLNQFDGSGTGALSIDRGGRAAIVVKAIRRSYNGAIRLQLENLPPGVTASEVILGPGQTQTTITLAADFDSESDARFVRLKGIAQIGNRTVQRWANHPIVYSGLPLASTSWRYADSMAVGISNQGAELVVRGKLLGPLVPGTKVGLELDVRRRKGIDGEVKITASNLPTGIAVAGASVKKGQTRLKLTAVVALDADPGQRSLELRGEIQRKNKGKQKQPPIVAVTSIQFTVQPILSLSLEVESVDAIRGRQTPVRLRVKRNSSVAAPITLSTSRLPRGVTIAPLKIPPNVDEVTLNITATADAKVSPIRRLIKISPVMLVNEKKRELPTLRLALKVRRTENN